MQATPEGQKASVFVGRQIPLRTRDSEGAIVVFKNAGVQVDVTARTLADGLFGLTIRFERTGGPTAGVGARSSAATNPVLQVVRGDSSLTLRDGVRTPFLRAVDPVTGDLVHVDVAVEALPITEQAAADDLIRASCLVRRRNGDVTLAQRPYSVTLQPGEGERQAVERVGGIMLPVETSYDGKPTVMLKDVGAGLRLTARRLPSGAYRLAVALSDGSLVASAGSPRVQAAQAETVVDMRVGETLVVASALDPFTGDIVETEMTLEAIR